MRSACVAGGVVLFLFVGAITAKGQGFQGGLRGGIADSAGADTPGVVVTITNEGTNVTRTSVTNEAGQYVFGAVIPALTQ